MNTDGALKFVPAAPPAAAEPPPAGLAWITQEEARVRLGDVNIGSVRRLCLECWYPAGRARKVRSEATGRETWEVHESADPRLLPVKFPTQLRREWDGGHLDKVARAKVLARIELLDKAERHLANFPQGAGRKAAVELFCQTHRNPDNGRPLAVRTLYNWLSAYRKDGPAGLEDGRSIRQAAARAEDPFFAAAKRFYQEERERSKTLCWELACQAARDHGWPSRSYAQTKRYLRCVEEIDERARTILKRKGHSAYVEQCEPFHERDYSKLTSNQVWVGDTRTLDVAVDVGGGRIMRPFLTAWQDARSRKIVGWHLHAEAPSTDHVLLSLRHALHPELQDCGVPEEVYVDNGKTYDNWVLQGQTKWQRRKTRCEHDAAQLGGIFGGLGVKVTHCEPYHGQSKPIERWFETVKEQFDKRYDTYTGGTTTEKPEDLARMIKAGRAPTLEQLRADLANYVGMYHARGHGGQAMDGRPPQQVWLDCMAEKRVVSARLCDVLLLPTRPTTAGQNGVTVDGVTYGQAACVEHRLLGQDVIVRLPPEAAHVLLFTARDQFICVAPSNRPIDFRADRQTVHAAQKEKRRLARLQRDHGRERMRLHLDVAELANRMSAERAAEADGIRSTDPTPPTLRPVRSNLEGQLEAMEEALERAKDRRTAVGLEGRSLDELEAIFSRE